jgi:hypothetical protein
MRDSDRVSVTFVNTVIGRGSLNGVINLAFSTFNFTPNDNGQVDADPVISCRLRMDKVCATQLRDVMNELLAMMEEAERNTVMNPPEAQTEGIMPKKAAEKMN